MTIPKLTPYTGQVANPDGSQTQTEFTQNMFGQLSYEAQLATELDATIDGMNNAVDEVEANSVKAESAANTAEALLSGNGYKGLWPDTGGLAEKGDTYQTQVGGTPTGEYFTALQNTTVDPVGDNVNWRSVSDQRRTFDNVADMKAAGYLSRYTEGTRIEWNGYYEQSDGGGNCGVLKFGAHTEDGGSIFSIDTNTYIKANLIGTTSVLKFGVVMDGTLSTTEGTPNADALQSAINAVDSISIPPGVMHVEKPIVMPTYPNTNNVIPKTIKGAFTSTNHLRNLANITYSGSGAMLDFRKGDNTQTECEGFNLEGIGFYGMSSKTSTSSIIDAYDMTGTTINNCSFARMSHAGNIERYSYYNNYYNCSFKLLVTTGFILNDTNGSTFTKCRFNQIGTLPAGSGSAVVLGATEGLTFDGCWIEYAARAIQIVGAAKNVRFLNGCYFEGVKILAYKDTADDAQVYIDQSYAFFYYSASRFGTCVLGGELLLKVSDTKIYVDPGATVDMRIALAQGGSVIKGQFINSPYDKSLWSDTELTKVDLGGSTYEILEGTNGMYTRYSNGLMIINMTVNLGAISETTSSPAGFYRTQSVQVNFDRMFIDNTYALNATHVSSGLVGEFCADIRVSSKTTNNAQLRGYSTVSTTTGDIICDLIAVGRWR